MNSKVDVRVPFAVQTADVELQLKDSFPGEVLAGNPALKAQLIWESPDGQQSRGVFEAEPGTFSWSFAWDEFFVIVSGRATVETSEGEILELVPGTAGIFKAGDQTTWTIHETLRKGFHKGL
ncbi:cupin domain-containing protein [Paenarthrobacter sp. NPDC058040]|uniref:cupin domain-containing protein n=1 Tax=unclassified Paenarthrobacter TaxID=2634190 RepID=UPI0036DABA8F